MDFLNTLYYNHLKKISIPEKNRDYLLRTTPLKHKAHLLFNFLSEEEREKLFKEGLKELNFEILSLFSFKKFDIQFLLKNCHLKGCFNILLNYLKNTRRPPHDLLSYIHNKEDILRILVELENGKIENSDAIFSYTDCCEKRIAWIRLYKKYNIKIKKFDEFLRKVNIGNLKNYILKGTGEKIVGEEVQLRGNLNKLLDGRVEEFKSVSALNKQLEKLILFKTHKNFTTNSGIGKVASTTDIGKVTNTTNIGKVASTDIGKVTNTTCNDIASTTNSDIGKVTSTTCNDIGKVTNTTNTDIGNIANTNIGKVASTTCNDIGKVASTTCNDIGKVASTTDIGKVTSTTDIGKVTSTTNSDIASTTNIANINTSNIASNTDKNKNVNNTSIGNTDKVSTTNSTQIECKNTLKEENKPKFKKPLLKRKLKLFSKKQDSPYKTLNLVECTSESKIFRPTEKFTDQELEIFKKKSTEKIDKPPVKIKIPAGIFDYKKNMAVEIPMKKFKLSTDDLITLVENEKLDNQLLITVIYENWPTEKEIVKLKEGENLTFTENLYRKLLDLPDSKKFFILAIDQLNEQRNGEVFTSAIVLLEKNLAILENEKFSQFISLFLQLENQLGGKSMRSFKVSSLFSAVDRKVLLLMKKRIDVKYIGELLEEYKSSVSYAGIKNIHKELKTSLYNEALQKLERRLLTVEKYIGENIDEEFNRKMDILKNAIRLVN